MKNKKYIFLSLILMSAIALFALPSCNDYLNREEDESMTLDKVWTKKQYISDYYGQVWSFMPEITDEINNINPLWGCSDDMMLGYTGRGWSTINTGRWNPSNVPFYNPLWVKNYRGIREANIFLANIDKCSDPQVSKKELARWKDEVRFARAFYYFQLFRYWGPTILMGDEVGDITKQSFDNYKRSTLEETAKYIISEFTFLAKNGVLPPYIDNNGDAYYAGHPTSTACYAFIALVKLYMARPLFNGCEMYKNVRDKDGVALFPQTTNDLSKWKEAVDANKLAIDMAEQVGQRKLHGYTGSVLSFKDACKAYQELFLARWDDETIFTFYEKDGSGFLLDLTPRSVNKQGSVNAYGGVGPSQSMVDSYSMYYNHTPGTDTINYRYPFELNSDETVDPDRVDPSSGYSRKLEFAQSKFDHPLENHDGRDQLDTPNMFQNREPRFYASVLWSSAWPVYYKEGNDVKPCFATNGNAGPSANEHNYPLSGYMIRKYASPKNDVTQGSWGEVTFPAIRLAGLYLNYCEAVIESGETSLYNQMYQYWDAIRARAGLPDIRSVYGNNLDQAKLRMLIRRERKIELFGEDSRYFDTRQWMVADKVNGGDFYGMNIYAKAAQADAQDTPSDFWKRTALEKRVFNNSFYLFPIAQSELERDHNLVQNYGW